MAKIQKQTTLGHAKPSNRCVSAPPTKTTQVTSSLLLKYDTLSLFTTLTSRPFQIGTTLLIK